MVRDQGLKLDPGRVDVLEGLGELSSFGPAERLGHVCSRPGVFSMPRTNRFRASSTPCSSRASTSTSSSSTPPMHPACAPSRSAASGLQPPYRSPSGFARNVTSGYVSCMKANRPKCDTMESALDRLFEVASEQRRHITNVQTASAGTSTPTKISLPWQGRGKGWGALQQHNWAHAIQH